MRIIDTNTLSDFFKTKPIIVENFASTLREDTIATTVITEQEILSGRLASIVKASNSAELEIASQRFLKDRANLASFEILFFNRFSIATFATLLGLRHLKVIGRSDLLIASIALARDAIVVTRNIKHFSLVPKLRIENWFD